MIQDVLVFYVPVADTDSVLEPLFDVGAGRTGNYEYCAFVSQGTGQFRPVEGADPAIGSIGEVEKVAENKVEVVFPRDLTEKVLATLRSAHPYEEPVFHIIRHGH